MWTAVSHISVLLSNLWKSECHRHALEVSVFNLAQVRPFSFPSLCISTLWLSLCAPCGRHDRLTRSRRGSRFACMRVSLKIVPSHPHERSTFVFNLINLSFNFADQLNPVHKIHRMRSMALWPKQPLVQVMGPSSSTTPTTQRLIQRSSRMNPST